jgi:hypothetical protein
LFDAPVSLVSLVDENRQWFKSCLGIDGARHRANCHSARTALDGSDVLLGARCPARPRFADNPLVIDGPAHSASSPAAPLRVAAGSRVGTLCVLDVRPRIMSEREIGLLAGHGGLVEKELTPQLIARPELASMTG